MNSITKTIPVAMPGIKDEVGVGGVNIVLHVLLPVSGLPFFIFFIWLARTNSRDLLVMRSLYIILLVVFVVVLIFTTSSCYEHISENRQRKRTYN